MKGNAKRKKSAKGVKAKKKQQIRKELKKGIVENELQLEIPETTNTAAEEKIQREAEARMKKAMSEQIKKQIRDQLTHDREATDNVEEKDKTRSELEMPIEEEPAVTATPITKKQLMAIGGMMVFCLIIFLFDATIATRNTREKEQRAHATAIEEGTPQEAIETTEELILEEERRIPGKSDSRKYGMVVKINNALPKSQEDFNIEIARVVRSSLLGHNKDIRKDIYQAIEEDPEKIKEKMKQVDDVIKECEAALEAEPDNEDVKARIERLMMLKAVAKALEESKLYAENDNDLDRTEGR